MDDLEEPRHDLGRRAATVGFGEGRVAGQVGDEEHDLDFTLGHCSPLHSSIRRSRRALALQTSLRKPVASFKRRPGAGKYLSERTGSPTSG
jgi:hypothetical protein